MDLDHPGFAAARPKPRKPFELIDHAAALCGYGVTWIGHLFVMPDPETAERLKAEIERLYTGLHAGKIIILPGPPFAPLEPPADLRFSIHFDP